MIEIHLPGDILPRQLLVWMSGKRLEQRQCRRPSGLARQHSKNAHILGSWQPNPYGHQWAGLRWRPPSTCQSMAVNAIQTPATKTLASFWGLGWQCGLRRPTRPATTNSVVLLVCVLPQFYDEFEIGLVISQCMSTVIQSSSIHAWLVIITSRVFNKTMSQWTENFFLTTEETTMTLPRNYPGISQFLGSQISWALQIL